MPDRRHFITGIVGVGTVGIAGCTDIDSESASQYPNDTHTHEPESDDLTPYNTDAELRDNNELWGIAEVSNPTGRPIYEATVRFTALDELGDPIGLGGPTATVKSLHHGDTRLINRYWSATRSEKEAIRGISVSLEDINYASTEYFRNNSGECSDVGQYQCGNDIKIESYDDDLIDAGSGQEWTVFGEIKNMSDSQFTRSRSNEVVAHYVNDDKIVEGWYTEVPSIDPGESSQFRITFPYGPGVFNVRQSRPQGNLRLSLISEY